MKTSAAQKENSAFTLEYKHLQKFTKDFMYGVAAYLPKKDGKEFQIIDLNKAGEEMTGKKMGEVIGLEIREAFPGVEEMGLFDALQQVYKTGNSRYLPAKNYQDDRLVLWTENFLMKLPSGEIIAIFEDKTEEKLLEKELNLIIEATNDGYFKWNLKNGKVFYSKKWKEMVGYKDGEISDDIEEWRKRLHPADRERVLKTTTRYIEGKNGDNLEFKFRLEKKDGTYASVIARTTRITDKNKDTSAIHGILIDISDTENIKLELQEKVKELERLNDAMVGRELKMVQLKKELNKLRNADKKD